MLCHKCSKEWPGKTSDPYSKNTTRTTECQTCANARREAKFAAVCPALYADTDAARLPQGQYSAAMRWERKHRGLILLGDTGRGKSRIAWLVVRKVMVDQGKDFSFKAFDCVSFGHEIARQYRLETAEEWLEEVASCGLVFFDDLGKLKLTERAEAELFGVVERRCAAKLPVIVTTNDTGDTLAARMTDNRGPALIRRLREFCDPIQF